MSTTAGEQATQPEEVDSAGIGSARVVFDANWDIYVAEADGSGLKRLTTSPAREYDPSWSPDGSKIAYRHQPGDDEGKAEIYVMSANGSGKRNLSRSPGQDHSPAWSPDGTKIAFASTRGQEELVPYIWVMNADGSDPTRVTTISGEYPAWSRDGRRIAFDVNTDIQPNIGDGSPADFDVFVVNADGSDLRRLTDAPGADQGPSWPPDGAKIVFHPGPRRRGALEALVDERRRIPAKTTYRPRRVSPHLVTRRLPHTLLRRRDPHRQARRVEPEEARFPGEVGFADWAE